MKNLLEEYGVFCIGFLDCRELGDAEYTTLSKITKSQNYFINDIGDGAYEPFISKVSTQGTFMKIYSDIESGLFELESSPQDTLSEYFIHDVDAFREKITSLI